MSGKKFELLRADLIRQVDEAIEAGENLNRIYFAIGNSILDHDNRRDHNKKILYALFRNLQQYLRDTKQIGMPNPAHLRNLAAAYRGIHRATVNRALVFLDWPVHITLINTVKDTSARLFYLKRAIKGGWDCSQLKHEINAALYESEGNRPGINFIKLGLKSRR